MRVRSLLVVAAIAMGILAPSAANAAACVDVYLQINDQVVEQSQCV